MIDGNRKEDQRGKGAGTKREHQQKEQQPAHSPIRERLKRTLHRSRANRTATRRLRRSGIGGLRAPTCSLRRLGRSVTCLRCRLGSARRRLVGAGTLCRLGFALTGAVLVLKLDIVLNLIARIEQLVQTHTVELGERDQVLGIGRALRAFPFTDRLARQA